MITPPAAQILILRMNVIIRFEGVYMKNNLKAIIDEFGRNALAYPDDLCAAMREKGIPEKDILTIQLILKCCPSVSGVLISGNFSESELNMLIRSAVQTTGLSTASVRSTLGMLFHACGYEAGWKPHLVSFERKSSHRFLPVTIEEGETLEELQERLDNDSDLAEVLSDLNNLAEQGSVDANYKLGKYYKVIDDKFNTETALPYFTRAAQLGYGPANGAVADYLLRREQKNMEKIADSFRNPTALAGADGREWTKISALVLKYQQDNKLRQKSTLITQLIFFVLSFVVTLFSGVFDPSMGFLCSASLWIQGVSLLWSLYTMWFKPFGTVKYAYYGMNLGCLLLILGLF